MRVSLDFIGIDLIDLISENLQGIQYAREITIHVKLQPKQTDGLISPPYVEIDYNIATYDDYLRGKNVTVIALLFSQSLNVHFLSLLLNKFQFFHSLSKTFYTFLSYM